MSNIHRGFVIPLLLILVLVAVSTAYVYMRGGLPDPQTQSTNSVPASATSSVQNETEAVFTGGDAHLPDCAYDTKNQCELLTVTPRIELSESVKNSTYLVTVNSTWDNGWYHTYFIGLPILEVRFLDAAQSLITREDYDKLFTGNELNAKTFVQTFSVHCSSDKAILPTVTDGHCYSNNSREDSYLFNDKGERLVSEAEVRKYLIDDANSWINTDASLLETIKRMKVSDPATFSTFPDGYISSNSPLKKIDVVYSGAIENTQFGTRLVPKNKIEEISYFKDGSKTLIKF